MCQVSIKCQIVVILSERIQPFGRTATLFWYGAQNWGPRGPHQKLAEEFVKAALVCKKEPLQRVRGAKA